MKLNGLFVSHDRAVITKEKLIVNESCQSNVEHTLNAMKEVLISNDTKVITELLICSFFVTMLERAPCQERNVKNVPSSQLM